MPRSGAREWSARGALLRDGDHVAATIDFDAPAGAGGSAHPVAAAFARLAASPPERRTRPRVPLAEAQDIAPPSMDAFARISGDHNPLHRCILAARLGGLARPIVHGAWTAARAAAFVVEALGGGDARALRRWRIDFVAPVALGAALELGAVRVALQDGLEVVEVTVLADGALAAVGEALLAPPRTVHVFCGQGVQRRGLGADGRARSRAAREVWQRADAHTRARLGFSLLDVAERNPTELRLADGRVLRHPDGVLARTELTQPALVTLHAAQLAELHEAGALGDELLAAGHSAGEFSALLALGALELEAALELVHARGELMQQQVARDARGASGHGMATVDPAACGLQLDGLRQVVSEIAGLELVNHNALGRQYAVAGSRSALEALAARLGPARRARPAGRRRPVSLVEARRRGGAAARAARAARRRNRPPPARRTLGAERHRHAVRARSRRRRGARRRRARGSSSTCWRGRSPRPCNGSTRSARLSRPPSPAGSGARRIVELGPAGAPVLTGLMRTTLAGLELAGPEPELLHAEMTATRLRADRRARGPWRPRPNRPRRRPPRGGPPAAVAVAIRATPDRPVDAGAALRLVLAIQARVRPDQLDDDEPLDDLFQGASSRRNQVLLDLAASSACPAARASRSSRSASSSRPCASRARTIASRAPTCATPSPPA